MKQVIFLLLLPITLQAQDITGVWTGFIYSGGNKLPYEIAINQNKEKYSGYALTIFSINTVQNIGVKTLKVKEKKGKLYIEDEELVYDNFSTKAKRIKLTASLQLFNKRSSQHLSGQFTTRAIDMRELGIKPYSGTIELQKKDGNEKSNILGVLHELDLLNTLTFLSTEKKENEKETKVEIPTEKREKAKTVTVDVSKPAISSIKEKFGEIVVPSVIVKDVPTTQIEQKETVVVREIIIHSDSLVLALYDNGEVDGDTVSVIMNGRVVMNKIGLTATGIKQTIYLTPDIGDSILLVMNAENLGTLPPNTGLLIVRDGTQRYDVRFIGDYQKNSAIVLRRKR